MAADEDPPRKFYGLKPKEFDRVNEPAAPAPVAPEPTPSNPASASPTGRIDVRDLTRSAAKNMPLLSGNIAANRPNEVHAVLRDNVARADAAGLNELAPKAARVSRRRRDYWLL